MNFSKVDNEYANLLARCVAKATSKQSKVRGYNSGRFDSNVWRYLQASHTVDEVEIGFVVIMKSEIRLVELIWAHKSNVRCSILLEGLFSGLESRQLLSLFLVLTWSWKSRSPV